MMIDYTKYNTQTKTKFIYDGMVGAPTLTMTRGDLVKLLKTVLVDGFNERTPTSFETDNETLIITVTFDSGHGFYPDQVVSLTGATDESLNKEYRVLYADSTQIHIKNNLPITGGITGDIRIKVAPLGYTLEYDNISASGTACFKNKHTTSPSILKIIDAVPPNGYDTRWARYARVVAGKEIDTNGDFLSNMKIPRHNTYPDMEKTGNGVSGAGGIHGLMKWDYVLYMTTDYGATEVDQNYGSYPTNWRIIGDDKTFYLMIKPMGRYYSQYNILSFGCYKSNTNLTDDFILTGSQREIVSNTSGNGKSGVAWRMGFTKSDQTVGNFIYKNSQNLYDPFLNFKLVGLYSNEDQRWWPSRGGINPIDPLTGNIFTTPMFIIDSQGYFRGELRGIQQFYGVGKLPDMTKINGNKNIVLTTKMFNWDWSSDENIPYLYSLEDWPEE